MNGDARVPLHEWLSNYPFLSLAPLVVIGVVLVFIWRYSYPLQRKRWPRCTLSKLYRYVIKGLPAEELPGVFLGLGETIPHDRCWALLYGDATEDFNPARPVWVHKSNFLCAFTAGPLLHSLQVSFDPMTLQLHVQQRGSTSSKSLLVAPLHSAEGRKQVSDIFSQLCGRSTVLISATDVKMHQFGNTPAGERASGDLRTLHLVNAETVAQLSTAIGKNLDFERFRPNLVLQGLEPWTEFGWVGGRIRIGETLTLSVISRTIRCEAVNTPGRCEPGAIDAGFTANEPEEFDLPSLIAEHFPEHGPYLGVYCQVVTEGTISPGDSVRWLGRDS